MDSRHDPFEQMNRFFEQIRRQTFDPGFSLNSDGFNSRTNSELSVDTAVSVEETEDGYAVVADLPGFESDELDIRFQDGLLSIRGESEMTEENEDHTHRRSRRVHERLSVPSDVVEAEISASYRNGVLEVFLPVDRTDSDDIHQIEIN